MFTALGRILRSLSSRDHVVEASIPLPRPLPPDHRLSNTEMRELEDDAQWFGLRVRHELDRLGLHPGAMTLHPTTEKITVSIPVRLGETEMADISDVLTVRLIEPGLTTLVKNR